MIKIYCDKCSKDCGLNAYDIMVNVLHNPTPHNAFDISQPCITDDNTHIRFTLCQDCYAETGFPNVYSVERKGLIFERMCEPEKENKQIRCSNCKNDTDELSGECYECIKGIEDWYEPLEENKE